MKTIIVDWIDADFRDHEFKMEVPKDELISDIDREVLDKIFDKAVDDYKWRLDKND